MEVITMLKKGDKPGKGLYVCKYCGKPIQLKEGDRLSHCSNCFGIVYKKHTRLFKHTG